ncbi:MAG: bifunctional UDP-N-acetylmuramoyl-tripeptide:D-alanyl-D-alanine ligase/alanine racemase [Flavisolibacter sp.]
MYSIETICSVVKGEFQQHDSDDLIGYIVTDSRRVQQPVHSVFFAIKTFDNDGHKYILDAYKKGVRSFITSSHNLIPILQGVSIIIVQDVLESLQLLAIHHRGYFSIPVIGITGSNGKTIVKEWLYQLLQESYQIVRSPKSFNSQLGVPLSVWQINNRHNLGIFEAGISLPGEMVKLESIIQPTIGILTNIGEAHDSNFSNRKHKLLEKLLLFKNVDVIIGQYEILQEAGEGHRGFTWGQEQGAVLRIISILKSNLSTTVVAVYNGEEITIKILFIDDASIQNAIHCWCVLIYLKMSSKFIQNRFVHLHPVDMRLQLQHGINGCMVINDSYNADLTSLKIAMDFLKQQGAGLKKTIILSDFIESGLSDEELYKHIADLVRAFKINKVVGVGEKIRSYLKDQLGDSVLFESYRATVDYLNNFFSSAFSNEIILIKGARKFQFERIAQLFERKLHQTVLEINLNALSHNLRDYKKLLQPGTKIMAMVKAFSYGSGGAEIASVLQFDNVDYLGVAYADEGVELVKAGIYLPIMVINVEPSSFQSIIEYQLEPVIYSFEILRQFETYIEAQGLSSWPVHIEIETGMNRLGFIIEEVETLAKHLEQNNRLLVKSVFSHLAASEDPKQDAFTEMQYSVFVQAALLMQGRLPYEFLRHIANSAGIVRHPNLQMTMVRLGIGLYGIGKQSGLEPMAVATLRSTIAQLKRIKKGQSVGYNRKSTVKRDSLIATIRIGYADGYSRQFGNGIGKMWINGKLAPVIGSVCMDMTMLDVTDLDNIKEGDDVVVFGPGLPLHYLAGWSNTIPYEIMTSISQRVKRIYFHE